MQVLRAITPCKSMFASDGWTFANGQVKNANGDVLLTIAYANKYTLTGNDNNATDKMHITNRSTATLALTGKITGDVSAGGDVDVSGAGTITGDVSTGSVVQVSGAGTITGDVECWWLCPGLWCRYNLRRC